MHISPATFISTRAFCIYATQYAYLSSDLHILCAHMHTWCSRLFCIYARAYCHSPIHDIWRGSNLIESAKRKSPKKYYTDWFNGTRRDWRLCDAETLRSFSYSKRQRKFTTEEIYFLNRFWNSTFKGIGYLQVLFLLLNLETWNLACVCKIEIP